MAYIIDMQPARGALPSGRAYAPPRRRAQGPSPFRRAGRTGITFLGAGTPVGEQAAQIVGGSASIAAGAAEAAGITASTAVGATAVALAAIPIVGAVAALAALLATFIGGGCGSACVEAAEAEQIYEAAADNLLAAGKLGMISRSEAIAGMQALIQAGQQHEAQFMGSSGETRQAQNGSANLTKVINAEIADAQNLPEAASAPIDLARAHSAYVSSSGWYPASLAAASQASDEYLSQLASSRGTNPPNPAAAAAPGIIPSMTVPSVSVAGVQISPLLLLLGLGALYLVL